MIVAVDPGSMTGIVMWEGSHYPKFLQISHTEAADLFLRMDWESADVDTVVIERFIITSSTTKKSREGMHHALNLIGLITHLARHNGVRIVLQTPAEGKRITKTHLEEKALWAPGMQHSQDAARHLYLHLLKEGKL